MNWNENYRQLEEGEILQEGDQVQTEILGIWYPTIRVGMSVPNSAHYVYRIYRRRKNPLDYTEEAIDAHYAELNKMWRERTMHMRLWRWVQRVLGRESND